LRPSVESRLPLGRPKGSPKVEGAIRSHLSVGNAILKMAALVGVGSGAVRRVLRKMAERTTST
jgi:hypothetical protein